MTPDTVPILEAVVCECGHPRSDHQPSVRQDYLWPDRKSLIVCTHLFSDDVDVAGWADVCGCMEFTPCPTETSGE